jgi:hypothetical protein
MWATKGLVPVWNDSLSLWQHATAAQPAAVYGHLKLGETYRSQKRYDEAAACYLWAGEIERHSIKGPAGLLHTFGERAEAEGRIPVGTTKQWEDEIADKRFDGRQMDTLIETTDLTGCRSCADAMLWLGLRMFPQKDTSLVRFARKALDRGRTRTAMFYLNEVRDSNTEGLVDLVKMLKEKQEQQEPAETLPR